MRSLTLAALSLISLPFALVLAPAATPAQDDAILLSPEALGQIFCLSRTGNDMAPVEGLLTDNLAYEIAKAEEESDPWAAAHPGEKPPLGDGVPWADSPDYAPNCTVGTVALSGDKALVTINYGFPSTPPPISRTSSRSRRCPTRRSQRSAGASTTSSSPTITTSGRP